jgi:ribosome-binding protein aMBF1 (putative translation factor)
MGRRPRPLTPGASALARFGSELRRWRTERGYSQQALARRVWHSQELVAKIEKAERWPSSELAARCDRLLETGGVLATLWVAVEREHQASLQRRGSRSARCETGPAAPARSPAASA